MRVFPKCMAVGVVFMGILALAPEGVHGSKIDLTRAGESGARAAGTILHIEGRLADEGGEAIADAALRIWQTDARGYYRDEAAKRGLLDATFGYQATLRTDAEGRFELVTILPASYAEHPQVTPHIHVAVERPGRSVENREIVFRNHPGQRSAPRPHPRAVIAELKAADEIEANAVRCSVSLVIPR